MVDHRRRELIGTLLDGRYRVLRLLGSGSTGLVFQAQRLATLDDVVIKALRPRYTNDNDLRSRLRREAEVAQRVYHPGIVQLIDQGTLEDGSPYLVMEMLHGESLADYMRRTGPLRMSEAALIARQVASILHTAHAAGYVHRDVKPEHIYITATTQGEMRVRLLDFGVCSSKSAPLDQRQREEGRVFGTPSYTSPEQALGRVDIDGRADLFSLGATLFEAISGQLPYSADDVNAVLRRIVNTDAPRLSTVTTSVDHYMDAVVSTLMHRTPDLRYPSARAVMRAVEPWLTQAERVEHRIVSQLMPSRHSDIAPAPRSRRPVVAA